MSPRQCRAARAWCGITSEELARQAGVVRITVSRFETGVRQSSVTANALRMALQRLGVEFVFSRTGEPIGIEGKP